RGLVAAVLHEQLGEDRAGTDGLSAPKLVERNVLRPLQPACRIPLGLAVSNVIEDWDTSPYMTIVVCHSLVSEISGASGRSQRRAKFAGTPAFGGGTVQNRQRIPGASVVSLTVDSVIPGR